MRSRRIERECGTGRFLDFGNEGLRAWVKMSIPLMLGVTVVFMDNIILSYFAKHSTGDISRLMYAKRLFTAPMSISGWAGGGSGFDAVLRFVV